MTTIEEATLIQERMRKLRGRLDDRATQLVASTEELLDWKTYARRHPAALVFVGLLAGWVVAPGLRSRARKVSIPGTFQGNVADAAQNRVANVARGNNDGLIVAFLRGAVSPVVKQLLWSYVKGMAVVHLDSLLKGVNAHCSAAAAASQTVQHGAEELLS